MVEVGPARDRLPVSLELKELKGNHWEPSIGGVCPTFQPLKVLSDTIWRNLATSHFDVGGFLFEIASVTEVHRLDFLNPPWQSSRGWNFYASSLKASSWKAVKPMASKRLLNIGAHILLVLI